LNAALPFATQMLAKHGEFLPYAVAMKGDGQIAMVAGDTGSEQPPSADVLAVIYQGLRAKASEYRAAAVVADVRLREEGTDAIQVEVEHREGIALKVLLPYRNKRFGAQIETGQMRGEAGAVQIWSH